MTTFTNIREASTEAYGVIGWVVHADLNEPGLGPRDWLIWRDQKRMEGFRYTEKQPGKFSPHIGETITYTPLDAPPAGSALEVLIAEFIAEEASKARSDG